MTAEHPPGLIVGLAGQWMYSRAALSFIGVTRHMPKGSEFAFPQGGSHSFLKRNDAARRLLEHPEWEWLATLDGDMVHPPDIIPRLLSLDASIAGGLYLLKEPDYTALAGHVPEEHAPEDVPEKRPTDHPDWKHRSLDLRKVGEDGLGVCDVDVVGSGAMLVHRRVFEALDPPWFVPNRDDLRTMGQNQDYNLCWRAKRDYGFKVVCDTRVCIEHIGEEGITLDRARDYWRRKVERERRAAG